MEVIEFAESFRDDLPTLQRSPDMDFKHEYRGFGTFKSWCNVKIWKVDGKAIILFTDRYGTSVTNAAELLITEIYNQYLTHVPKDKCLFIETYNYKRASYDIVIPRWTGDKVTDVDWTFLGIKA
jgi:hypothetical protein